MKKRTVFLGIGAAVALIGLSMTGCATPAPRPRARVDTEIFRAPWSAYTIIPSRNYVVVGAVALRNASSTTFLADLMERAIEMGGHDLINVRLAVTTTGHVTGATAVVIRYTDETVALGRSPPWAPLAAPRRPGDAIDSAPEVWPTQVIRVPWSAYTFIPSKHYVTVGAVAIRYADRDTLLVDLMERAIEMGGHDIINVRLAVAPNGATTAATAVVIMYTDETIYVAARALPEPITVEEVPAPALPEIADGIQAMLRRPQRTPRPPRERTPRPLRAGNHVNQLSVEASAALAGGMRYMRDISDTFSLGVNAFVGWEVHAGESLSAGASVAARFFPGGSPFYLELGLGVGYVYESWEDERWVSSSWGGDWEWYRHRRDIIGIMATPALGVKIDIDRNGLFFINPFISLPVVMGNYVRPTVSRSVGIGLGTAW